MRRHLLGLLLLSSLSFTGCDKATTVSVPMRGERLQHIVSLSPGTTEILATIAVNFEGRTKACDFPDMVKSKPIYGDLKPDFEKITLDKIQLVVVDADLYSEEDKTKLKSTGAKIFEFKATTVSDLEKEMLTLGSLVGSETNIQVYVDRIRRERRAAEGDSPSPKPKAVLILPGSGGTHMIAGVKSFQADLLKIIGAEPVGPESSKFEMLTPEFLFQANPDVIIVAGEAKSFLADTRFSNLAAVKGLKIFGNKQDMWVRRGGRIDTLIEQAHKALMLVVKK
ncbi:MAG: helical backbone metal receptor [Armatimonadota bacterium]